MNNEIFIKRAYEAASPEDGTRILVDRLWPRGESKVREQLSEWDKQIAPSEELRKAFHHQEISFDEFADAYHKELDGSDLTGEFLNHIRSCLKKGNVTLIYSSKDQKQNNAVILRDWILDHLKTDQS